MTAYYNENDPFAAAWLHNLIAENLIAHGEVDERSICDVTRGDLVGFTQHHFFAGIGGWSYALRLAGWPDDKPVWTGSCPCQPFSVAGKRLGNADKRHLWPDFKRLIEVCKPPTIFGEQVASAYGRIWLSGVRADLEAMGYACGAADLCAAGVGAPHIRQRLYWMADAECDSRDAWGLATELTESEGAPPTRSRVESGRCSALGRLGNADDERLEGRGLRNGECADQFAPWQASIFIPCIGGKHRRIPSRKMEHAESEQVGLPGFGREPRTTEETWEPEPALFPLAHGIPNRVGALRGAGNAICPQVAAEFIKASALI